MDKRAEIGLILYGVRIGQMDEGCAMKALDKLGVVIKVNRELPENEIHQPLIGYLNEKIDLFEATCSIQNIFIGAGYEAVESLI